MENTEKKETGRKGLWGIIDSIEGDKVILIIVLLLVLFSVLAIFSSTPLLSDESRIEIMQKHGLVAMGGLFIIFVLYKFINKIWIYRVLSQLGFFITFMLLLILDLHLDLGFIAAQRINGVYRTLGLFGLQIHVFEVAKVAMVMYLAWALHATRVDEEAMRDGRKVTSFWIANSLAETKTFAFMAKPFWKRVFYIYLPALVICAMIAPGSNSSAIFMGIIMIGTMIIGGVPFKELFLAGGALVVAALLLFGIYKASDGKYMKRLATFESRLQAEYTTDNLKELKPGTKEFYAALDEIRQPYGAKVAVHEGGLTGKGSGNSTQKYSVTHIYSDYMFSFIIEEYGLLGGILIILLYVSLIARSSMIARLCGNEFAKIAVGGLAFLITGQAFMHMLVNVDIGPMTGQTLPLLSDGASAFLVSCLAFGIILSISRMAKHRVQKIEAAAIKAPDNIQAEITKMENQTDEQIQG